MVWVHLQWKPARPETKGSWGIAGVRHQLLNALCNIFSLSCAIMEAAESPVFLLWGRGRFLDVVCSVHLLIICKTLCFLCSQQLEDSKFVSAPHQNSGSFKVHPNTSFCWKKALGLWRQPMNYLKVPSEIYPINGSLLCQDSWLGNPKDRGAWRATVHGVSKSQTRRQLNNSKIHNNQEYPFLVQVYSSQKYKTLCQFHLRASRTHGSHRMGFRVGAWQSVHRQAPLPSVL